jgi:diguanylate cyclase (GGDEF)-like protein
MKTLRDSRGFVWLGTEDGLVRYDERELKRYGNSPSDPKSLPGQFIWDIAEDASGDLWVAIKNGGVARWHRDTDSFTVYRHDPNDPRSLASDNVRALLVSNGRVWIATGDAGVDILDPASGHMTHLSHDRDDSQSLSSDDVVTFTTTSDGSVLIGTDAGLHRWTPRTNQLMRFGAASDGRSVLQDTRVMQIHEDRGGTIWVATLARGLWHLGPDGTLIATYRNQRGVVHSLKNDEVRAVIEDGDGRLWVGTADGLDLLDRTTGEFTHFEHDAADPASLRDSFVMSLTQDSDGLLWIGTRTGGVSRWNPRSWGLGMHRPAWLGTEPVTAFADAPGGTLWVASLHAGLVEYDPKRRERVEKGTRAAQALGESRAMSLLLDKAGVLWVGTMKDGLKSLSREGALRSIPVKPGDPAATSAPGIMSLMQARDGQIWVGTFGGGVNVLDPLSSRVRQLPVGGANGIGGPNVTAMVQDANGNIWLGTDSNGLTLLRANGTVAEVYKHDQTRPGSLPADAVYALAIDATGSVWVGTEGGGLARVRGNPAQPDSLSFEHFGRGDGIFDTIYGILVGPQNELWLSGNSGLVRFAPSTRDVRTFRREHGLQGDEFSFGAHHRLVDGSIAFGGPGGFNVFDPTQLSARRAAPRIALTSIAVMGVPRVDDTPPWSMRDLYFNYRDNVVTLDFGVLDFAAPRGNHLAYRVTGLTDEWIDLGTQRRITLTNLQAGTSTLEVRAASPDSTWSEQPLRLTLHRAAPPWLSGWAYATYALTLLLAITARVRHQRRKMRQMVEAAKRIERLAYYDTLTGLANRQRCMEQTDRLIGEARADGSGVAVICLDLLGLKRVNDSFGHQHGDQVLRAFADRLVKCLGSFSLPTKDVIAGRFGGDEFVAVVKARDATSLARRIANGCIEAFARPIEQDSLDYFSAPGVGLAVFPDDGADAGTLFKCADTAVYHARSSGNATAVAYSDELAGRKRDWLKLESRLRHAVQNEQLTIVYQPKFRMRDRKLVGVEALLRWHDEVHGDVSPARFIEIAENSGLILDIGRWLTRAVCRQQRAWLDRGIEVPIAINCSGRELLHGDPARLVEVETAAANVPPSLIEIELTESVLVNDSQTVQATLERLRSLGCRIALDDFGTGYSSLAYLTRFPPDRIKIDKSFVRDVDRSEQGGAVASAILSLAQNLRMTVTAEGVERVGQFDWLYSRGCHEIQGFLLAKPMPARELEERFLSGMASPMLHSQVSAG